MHVLDAIKNRHSVSPRHLHAPGPSNAELCEMVNAACAAPDHGQLGPFRFIVIPDHKRAALAEVFVEAALEANENLSFQQLEAARERSYRSPCLLAMVVVLNSDIPSVPKHEQWMSAGAAMQNVLLAAESFSYRAMIVSGLRVRSRALRRAFRLNENEILAGFFAIGTPSSSIKMMPRRRAADIMEQW